MKKQLHIYKHLGYFNEIPDIRELSRKSADEILDYYKKGYGRFYEDDCPDSVLIEEDEIVCGNVKSGDTKFTADKKYAITDTSWDGWKEDYKDSEDGDISDCYIDIWELTGTQESEEDVTYEVCPYCGKEVELDAELKVQVCPECGKHIVTCSMCRNAELNYPCKDCCLEILAHLLNDEEAKEEIGVQRPRTK